MKGRNLGIELQGSLVFNTKKCTAARIKPAARDNLIPTFFTLSEHRHRNITQINSRDSSSDCKEGQNLSALASATPASLSSALSERWLVEIQQSNGLDEHSENGYKIRMIRQHRGDSVWINK